MANYIKHHGIKGQKWGVRRFQNKDGSLTPAGEKRYNSEKSDEEREAERKLDEAMRNMQKAMFKRNVSTADEMVKKATESYGKMSKAKKEAAKKEAVKKIKDDVSKMSDKELKAIVNRLNMEERYTQIMSSRVETGRDKVGELLETVGKLVATGVTVMTLMDKMEKLKTK